MVVGAQDADSERCTKDAAGQTADIEGARTVLPNRGTEGAALAGGIEGVEHLNAQHRRLVARGQRARLSTLSEGVVGVLPTQHNRDLAVTLPRPPLTLRCTLAGLPKQQHMKQQVCNARKTQKFCGALDRWRLHDTVSSATSRVAHDGVEMEDASCKPPMSCGVVSSSQAVRLTQLWQLKELAMQERLGGAGSKAESPPPLGDHPPLGDPGGRALNGLA